MLLISRHIASGSSAFFEEIDYGLHYVEYAHGKTKEQVDYQIVVQHQVRNFHNIGHTNSYIKFLAYACTVVLFVILPLLPEKHCLFVRATLKST